LTFLREMSNFDLVLVVSPDNGIDLWDVQSGSILRSYQLSVGGKGKLCHIDENHIIVCTKDKPVLQIVSWRTGRVNLKCPVLDIMGPMASSKDGAYFAAGCASGKVYIWSLASGELIAYWDAHYKPVSALRFTNDGSFLLSGGEDGLLAVWQLSDVVSRTSMSGQTPCYCEWAQHSLPITDIYIGTTGSAVSARIWSASLDRTVKLWDLGSKALVFSFAFPSFINCVLVTPCERHLFAGAGDGNIYQVDLQVQIYTCMFVCMHMFSRRLTRPQLSRHFWVIDRCFSSAIPC
jgi:pre-rRNA-processing protein IPI3